MARHRYRGHPPARYKTLYAPDHPLATRRGYVSAHRKVLYDKIGAGEHPCHWCGTPLRWMNGSGRKGGVMVDHVDGDTYNNDSGNLVPSCHGCNVWRKHPDRERDGDVWAARRDGSRTRAELRDCETCGAQFPHALADKRPNRGRFCSPTCMYNSRRRVTEPESPTARS